MKKSRVGILFAAVLIGVGVAVAAVSPSVGSEHLLTLSSGTHSVDTGVGLFSVMTSDSSVGVGVFFVNASNDTKMVQAAYPAKPIFGNPRDRLLLRASDTSWTSITTDFATATNSSGQWTSGLTNLSGGASSVYLTATDKCTDPAIVIGDSVFAPLNELLADGAETITYNQPFDSFVNIVGLQSGQDTARLIVIGPQNKVTGDTILPFGSANAGARVRFDTGVTRLMALVRDASQGKFKIFTGAVAVGAKQATNLQTVDSAISVRMGDVVFCTVTVTNALAQPVRRIDFIDMPNDAANGAVDGYSLIDSGTYGFDTRLPNSVFEIRLYDLWGQLIKSTSEFVTIKVEYNLGAFGTSFDTSKIKVLHLTDGNRWVALPSSVSTTNAVVTSQSKGFSIFALGAIGSSSPVDDNDNVCVVNRSLGGSVLSGVMPALRSYRDMVLGTSLGRLAVETYYGFAALLIVAAAGLGLARMRG